MPMKCARRMMVGGAVALSVLVSCTGSQTPDNPQTPDDDKDGTPATANLAPVANGGSDRTVDVGDSITLDASASFDANAGSTLTYQWAIISAPPTSSAELSGATAISASFVAAAEGRYVVRLLVSDGELQGQDLVVVDAFGASAGTTPVAAAGEDHTGLTVGQLVELDASSSSDPLSRPLAYSWSFVTRPPGSSAQFANDHLARTSFVPDAVGQYSVGLVVSAGNDVSAPDTVIVVVDNRPPHAEVVGEVMLQLGRTTVLDGSGSSDPDDDALTYAWTLRSGPQGSTAAIENADAVRASFAADLAGDYEIELVVNDGRVASAPARLTFTAIQPGVPLARAGDDAVARVGAAVTLDGSGSHDPETRSLTYAWTLLQKPSGSTATVENADAVIASLTPDVAGAYSVGLVVNNGLANSSQDAVTITANTPPVALMGSLTRYVLIDTRVTLDGTGSSDADGDPLTYQWSLVVPDGSAATLQPDLQADRPHFTPDLPGTYSVRLVVNDGSFASEQARAVVIAVTEFANQAPVANAGGDVASGPVRGRVVLDGSGSSDPDGDALTYQWSFVRVPDGAPVPALSSSSVVNPSFVPYVEGTYRLALVVSDGRLLSAPDNVVVTAVNVAPIADAGEDRVIPVDVPVGLDGTGSDDPNGDPLSYRWEIVAAPAGSAAFIADAVSPTPLFSADVPGSFTVRLSISDGTSSSTDELSITAVADAPIAVAGTDQIVRPDTLVMLNATASVDTRGTPQPLIYEWTFARLPPAVTEPVLSDPAADRPMFRVFTPGIYELRLVVTNSAGVASLPDTVILLVKVAPRASAGADALSMLRNSCYSPLSSGSLVGTATVDPNASPARVLWELTETPLGSALFGLTAATSSFSFRPDQAGSYRARFTVTDALGESASDEVLIATEAPVMALRTGADQTGVVDSALPVPLRVRVTTASGLAAGPCVSVRVVSQTGGGGASPSLVNTDSQGIATSTLRLGPSAGTQVFRASIASDPAVYVDVTATAQHGPAAFVLLEAADGVKAGTPMRLQAFVTDRSYNRVGGAAVRGVLDVSGSAAFGNTAVTGMLISGGGTPSIEVETADGAFAIDVQDTVAEPVTFTFADTGLTGLRVLGRRVLINEDFEDGPGGFSHESRSQFAQAAGGDDEWEHGTPTVIGPAAAHSGTRLWGTNLDGLCSFQSDSALVRTVDLRTVPTDVPRSAVLRFWHYEDLPNDMCETGLSSSSDTGALALFGVSNVGTGSISSTPTPTNRIPSGAYDFMQCGTRWGCVTGWACRDRGWRHSEFDLTASGGRIASLQWGVFYNSATVPRGAGFYVDDVELAVLQADAAGGRFIPNDPAVVFIAQPMNVRRGSPMRLEIELRDTYGNSTYDEASEFTVRVTGSATFSGVLEGTMVSGLSSNAIAVRPSVGRVVLELTDTAREAVTISLASPTPVSLDVSATVGAVFTDAPRAICITAGNNQSGLAGSTLPVPLAVRVVDEVGCPPSAYGVGSLIDWVVTSGGGSVDPATTPTDIDGRSGTTYTLGTRSADVQRVQAIVREAPSLVATFDGTAQPGPAARIAFLAVADTRVPGPATFVAQVQDAYGNSVDTDSSTSFTLRATGSAQFGAVTRGTFLGGSGQTVRVRVSAGEVAVQVTDSVVEDASIFAQDTEGTGLSMPSVGYDATITHPLICNGSGTSIYTFSDVPASSSDAQLILSSAADFGSPSEYVGIWAEAEGQTRLVDAYTVSGTDCTARTETVTIAGPDMTRFTQDGVVTLEARTSYGVDCSFCGTDDLSARLRFGFVIRFIP